MNENKVKVYVYAYHNERKSAGENVSKKSVSKEMSETVEWMKQTEKMGQRKGKSANKQKHQECFEKQVSNLRKTKALEDEI